jgi:hypothetical protein
LGRSYVKPGSFGAPVFSRSSSVLKAPHRLCRYPYLGLLSEYFGLQRIPELRSPQQFDLDEVEGALTAHDKVDLTLARPVVAG